MTTTPGTGPDMAPDIEERLRAALTARAELVRPEHLGPLAPVDDVRPRWQSPWVLLVAAAAVLAVLGVVRLVGDGAPRERLAPDPKDPEIVLPEDVGRDWKRADLSTPARLDLDGDGVEEKVVFLAEDNGSFDGRIRLQTTLSSTGAEAYGIAELGTTIGTTALDPVDADDDGDQELVLLHELDPDVVGGLYAPVVFDLRDGLLVQAVADQPDLLVRGNVPVPGSATEHYEMVRIHDYGVEDGQLFSSRSVRAFAAGNMTLMRPETIVMDRWRWTLGDDGVLRASDPECVRSGLEAMVPCGADELDEVPYVRSVADTIGVGEAAEFREGYRFTAGIEAIADPSVVVEVSESLTLTYGLEVADPRISTVQPTSVFSDGASVLVTSASDPTWVQVLVQDGDRLRALDPVGEIELQNRGDVRTWLTQEGALVTVVAAEDDTWQAWQWMQVSGTEMAALPTGPVCFEDVDDPTTARTC